VSPTYTPGPVEGVTAPSATAPPFTAVIYRLEEINLAVDAPSEVSDWFGQRGCVPIYGTLDAITIRATLVPTGEGRHRIYLNGPMREATGTGERDEVAMTIWWDEDPRDGDLPDDLRDALTTAGALDAFESWPPSHRREYLRAIEAAKRPETRQKYVERTVSAALSR
jgi:Bacteriocin-protection, YdeI or OmpD-Associated/Domain of unknown function (DUF1905)